jgi:hypothetical protein
VRILSAVAVASVLALSGCGEAPELRLGELDVTLGGVPDTPPPYFSVPLCSEDGDQEVTILDVRATEASGADLAFAVDWPGGEDAAPLIGAAAALPAAFEPAEGSTGTVAECGESETADLAVQFPATGNVEVKVERLEVTYEIDGVRGSAVGDVSFVQCPLGDEVGAGTADFCLEPSGG